MGSLDVLCVTRQVIPVCTSCELGGDKDVRAAAAGLSPPHLWKMYTLTSVPGMFCVLESWQVSYLFIVVKHRTSPFGHCRQVAALSRSLISATGASSSDHNRGG